MKLFILKENTTYKIKIQNLILFIISHLDFSISYTKLEVLNFNHSNNDLLLHANDNFVLLISF